MVACGYWLGRGSTSLALVSWGRGVVPESGRRLNGEPFGNNRSSNRENPDDNSGVKKKILEDTSTTDDPQIPDWPETEAFSVVLLG